MSGLPEQIPPQGEPIGTVDGRPVIIDINWYLWLYNVWKDTIGTGSGTVPISPLDAVDMVDLDAAGTDVPQSYRDITNVTALESHDIDLVSPDLPKVKRDVDNARALEALGEDLIGVEIASIWRRLTNIEMMLETLDTGASLRDLANAILLATDAVPQDPAPAAGAVIPITPGASPFTYTAIHDGTMFISGSVSATLALTRYGVNVPLGMSDGTVPLREKDQLTLTWSGGTAPTMNFLPNQ
ncbi:hypothetical protein [Burkholderia metallica]|uniref:hypothetical protein n=1 Tax=Burkholderia metallica TaxID=488729 RepID=UPI001CF58181|nr:hypothetical protein [Burkholderia metallica]MCA8018073.1 hypothetical protein [Burkholderia metallica]